MGESRQGQDQRSCHKADDTEKQRPSEQEEMSAKQCRKEQRKRAKKRQEEAKEARNEEEQLD